MSQAERATPEEAGEQGPEQATNNEIDTGVQAVEVIGWVARECATFFRRIAEKVKKYEATGDLPDARAASAQPTALIGPNGSEGLEKPKPSKRGRKGDKDKVKRPRAASYFNMFVKDQVELFNQQRKAQAEVDAKAGKDPAVKEKPTDTFKEAVAIWSSKSEGEKNEYKQKKAKEMIAAGLAPPATDSNPKSKMKKEGEPSGATPSAAPSAPKAAAPAAAPAASAPAPKAPAPAAAAAAELAPARPMSTPKAGAATTAPDATPASDPERKKKKKKKRKSEQVEPAGSMQTDGQLTEKKKKKKKKHHDHAEENAGP